MKPGNGQIDFWQKNSFLYAGNAPFVEALYENFLENPESVPFEWREIFEGWRTEGTMQECLHHRVIEELKQRAHAKTALLTVAPIQQKSLDKQIGVMQLIIAYRLRGHQQANLDPLGLNPRPDVPDLQLEYHGLGEEDLDEVFPTTIVGMPAASLREILAFLQQTYCGTIGVEYMHIADAEQRRWIQERVEGARGSFSFSAQEKKRILSLLIAAEGFEKYLHAKYVGQKRFSLEGGDSLIPAMDRIIDDAGGQGVQEIVIGMAHRGRLNVLVNILGKPTGELFAEFEGKPIEGAQISGDVKYHLGFSSNLETSGGPVHVSLGFNPSHLEIINPVVEGSVRARQDRRGGKREEVLPILIHGDASFAGQGVVMETFNLSQTRGFTTGGTLHLIINNQIGFTTSVPLDARSTLYCSDVAKAYQAPVLHVNGDDPEAVVFVAKLALDYRMRFHRDIVIDFVCYRRHGHNEADEPAATQPMMYHVIREHPDVRKLYAEKLIHDKLISVEEIENLQVRYRKLLDEGQCASERILTDYKPPYLADWAPFKKTDWTSTVDTSIPKSTIEALMTQATTVPDGFVLNPRVEKIIEARREMAQGRQAFDWGGAETLAYASLLVDGYAVRLSGQDSGRGTFFHRHAVFHDYKDGSRYIPLQHISSDQPQFLVIDSPLSEEAVLGFEVGYSSAEPMKLIIWEAQFGDFVNGAQVVVDQFISSSEVKWQLLSGVVLFLPHGYEGQGPEHSSARPERFLQLCAQQNMQVCIPSNAAQIFHLLRRQMLRPYRKPLVVFTPKSLLRMKEASSPIEALVNGGFKTIIPESEPFSPDSAQRLIFCTGKVYYDLVAERQARGIENIAIVRIEQLYPFPKIEMTAEIERYAAKVKDILWVQEEPKNQGYWFWIEPRINQFLSGNHKVRYVGRASSASPAAGYYSIHMQQQKQLVDEALSF